MRITIGEIKKEGLNVFGSRSFVWFLFLAGIAAAHAQEGLSVSSGGAHGASNPFQWTDTGVNAREGSVIGPGWEILRGVFRVHEGCLNAQEDNSFILCTDGITKNTEGRRFHLEVDTYIHGVGRHRRNFIQFNRQDADNFYQIFYWMEPLENTASRLRDVFEDLPPQAGRGVVQIYKVVNGSLSGNALFRGGNDIYISNVNSVDGRWLQWHIESTGLPGEFLIFVLNADGQLAFQATIKDDSVGGVAPFTNGKVALGRTGDANIRWGKFSLTQLDADVPLRSVKAVGEQMPVRRAVRFRDRESFANSSPVYQQDFEESLLPGGASGRVALEEGVSGKGLHLMLPNGRYDVAAEDFPISDQGTIEWWVRPRPAARVWSHAYGWWYFLHARSAEPGGFQLDVWRHMDTGFRLTASMGMVPVIRSIQSPPTQISMDTSDLDPVAWQHVVVSWDLSGERQRVWLLLNGKGEELSLPSNTFTPAGFSSLRFGNRPVQWDMPFLPMNGKIDQIRVYAESIAARIIPLQSQ